MNPCEPGDGGSERSPDFAGDQRRIAAAQSRSTFKVVLAGNPNAGKTTLSNALARVKWRTGNYPGVTVESAQARIRWGQCSFDLVDLPGTYSLSGDTQEEASVHEVLLLEKPDVVINVADACQLERQLYLTIELLEVGIPVVVALNMWDVAREKGLNIDVGLLSLLLAVPVIPTSARTREGIGRLLASVAQICQRRVRARPAPLCVDYGPDIEPSLRALTARVGRCAGCLECHRWCALKLLEGDEQCLKRFRLSCPGRCQAIFRQSAHLRQRIEQLHGEEIGLTGASRRYEYVNSICDHVIARVAPAAPSRTEWIDHLLLRRWLGLPLMTLVMYLMFQVTFTVAQPFVSGLEWTFDGFGQTVAHCWPERSESLLRSLLVEGMIGGVGGVAVFLPNILLLFLCLALLEQSGYMIRAVFVLERPLYRIGLPGRSFIPMMIGLGCTVPAILATRTLGTREDRLTTILVLPLISCSARLPIYTLIISAFFAPRHQAIVLWAVYLTGVVLATAGAKLIRFALFKEGPTPLIMELPPYRMPVPKEIVGQMWDRTRSFLKTAGTIILAISILTWALSVWPSPPSEQLASLARQRADVEAAQDLDAERRERRLEQLDSTSAALRLEHSAIGRIGQWLAPAFRPLGFDWKTSTAVIGTFAAREVFLAQMAVVHSVGTAGGGGSKRLREVLRQNYTPLNGVCLMLFLLIGPPCMATLAITRQETQSWKWPLLQLGGLTALAYGTTLLVHQTGLMLLRLSP